MGIIGKIFGLGRPATTPGKGVIIFERPLPGPKPAIDRATLSPAGKQTISPQKNTGSSVFSHYFQSRSIMRFVAVGTYLLFSPLVLFFTKGFARLGLLLSSAGIIFLLPKFILTIPLKSILEMELHLMSAEDIACQLKHRKSREIATVLGFLEKSDPRKAQAVRQLTNARLAN